MPARRLPQGPQLVGRQLARRRCHRCCASASSRLSDDLSDCACGWPLPLFPAHSTADNAHALFIGDTHAERAHDEQVAVGAIKLLGFIEGRIVHPGLVGSQLGPPVLPLDGVPRLLNRHVGQHQMHRIFLHPRNEIVKRRSCVAKDHRIAVHNFVHLPNFDT